MELECLVDFVGTAEWRHRKAEQFPDDHRNAAAVVLLNRFAEEARTLEGSDAHNAVVKAFEAAYAEWDEDDMTGGPNEAVSDSLRSVGFGYHPASAKAFLQDLSQSLRP